MAGVIIIREEKGETLRMGPVTIRILEDGSNTDNRIGAVSITIKPNTSGRLLHWHRMHDETFLVTKGRIRFTTDKGQIDAKAGDYAVVPTKAIHSFSNPFDEEAEFFNTFTPAYYVEYMRIIARAAARGKILTEQQQKDAMAQFATFLPGDEGKLE